MRKPLFSVPKQNVKSKGLAALAERCSFWKVRTHTDKRNEVNPCVEKEKYKLAALVGQREKQSD